MKHKRDFLICPYVFVYGTLLKGEANHGFLKDQIFVGKAETVDKQFIMYSSFPASPNFNFPFVVKTTDQPTGPVYGELYELHDDEALRYLDRLEGIDNKMYKRTLQKFRVKGQSKPMFAWIYVLPKYEANDVTQEEVYPVNDWKKTRRFREKLAKKVFSYDGK